MCCGTLTNKDGSVYDRRWLLHGIVFDMKLELKVENLFIKFLNCLKNDKSRTWEENQRPIMTVTTVEDFWSLYNHIETPSKLPPGSDFSLFKAIFENNTPAQGWLRCSNISPGGHFSGLGGSKECCGWKVDDWGRQVGHYSKH